jgi:hypothetical protein
MDFMDFTLDDLKFELNKAEEELKSISVDTFVLNPKIFELTKSIKEIKTAIDAKEEKENEQTAD